jgi:prefoldin subunit 5
LIAVLSGVSKMHAAAAAEAPRSLAAKIAEFAQLRDTVLKPTVERRRARLRELDEELREFGELRAQLDLLTAHEGEQVAAPSSRRPFKLLSEVGPGFHVQARVDDASRVAVHIGCGVYPELDLLEAGTFVDAKLDGLRRLRSGVQQELITLMADLEVAEISINALRGDSGAGERVP